MFRRSSSLSASVAIMIALTLESCVTDASVSDPCVDTGAPLGTATAAMPVSPDTIGVVLALLTLNLPTRSDDAWPNAAHLNQQLDVVFGGRASAALADFAVDTGVPADLRGLRLRSEAVVLLARRPDGVVTLDQALGTAAQRVASQPSGMTHTLAAATRDILILAQGIGSVAGGDRVPLTGAVAALCALRTSAAAASQGGLDASPQRVAAAAELLEAVSRLSSQWRGGATDRFLSNWSTEEAAQIRTQAAYRRRVRELEARRTPPDSRDDEVRP
jgi:hypothetical protein